MAKQVYIDENGVEILVNGALISGVPVEYTLPAASWDSGTHTITIAVTGVTATSNQEILRLPATSAANIQNNALLTAANLQDYGQTTGSITLYAENIPTSDLRVRIIIVRV